MGLVETSPMDNTFSQLENLDETYEPILSVKNRSIDEESSGNSRLALGSRANSTSQPKRQKLSTCSSDKSSEIKKTTPCKKPTPEEVV